jgi:hypothetical protein
MAATIEDFQYRIKRFKSFEEIGHTGMLNSVETQFMHMAKGGDGSKAMEGEIRKTYYPAWTDEDFKAVCKIMGWSTDLAKQGS